MEDKPIITSWLDSDFYDFTQGDLIHLHHIDVPVELSFVNRTSSVRLADMIDIGELREQLSFYQNIGFRSGEIHYLSGTYEYGQPMFRFEYTEFLRNLRKLPDFYLTARNGQFDLRFFGKASEVIYWEIPSMIIMKRLYLKSLTKGFSSFDHRVVEAEGLLRLSKKISITKKSPLRTFADFGTRRRYSFEHQRNVVGVLKDELPSQFLGTSNTLLAKEYDITPIGTNSHKNTMIYAGVYWNEDNFDPTFSQRKLLEDWENRHGLALSIFLPDTWNSDWFFKNVVTEKQLRSWKGSRHDSGSPIQYAMKMIRRYREIGIETRNKIIIFADNMNPHKMDHIDNVLRDEIPHTFGWGTDLTDDVGFEPISIVTKVIRSNGYDVAKISDEPSKATGTSEAIRRVEKFIS